MSPTFFGLVKMEKTINSSGTSLFTCLVKNSRTHTSAIEALSGNVWLKPLSTGCRYPLFGQGARAHDDWASPGFLGWNYLGPFLSSALLGLLVMMENHHWDVDGECDPPDFPWPISVTSNTIGCNIGCNILVAWLAEDTGQDTAFWWLRSYMAEQ